MSNSNEELSTKLAANGAALKPSSVVGQLRPWFYGSDDKPGKIQNIIQLCGDEAEAKRLYVAALNYITNRPDLMKCDLRSLQGCIMSSAVLNLHPGTLGEADYICYKDQAKFIVGYAGLIKLATQSGVVTDISSNVVYTSDFFEWEEGTNAYIKHKKFLGSKKDRGERLCVYAIANMQSGGSKFVIMTPDEVMSIKSRSQAKNSSYSPWNTDDEDQMWIKSSIKRLAKTLPKSTKALNFAKAIALDNSAEQPDDKDSSLLIPVFDEGEYGSTEI